MKQARAHVPPMKQEQRAYEPPMKQEQRAHVPPMKQELLTFGVFEFISGFY
jgi:hypothetical protein